MTLTPTPTLILIVDNTNAMFSFTLYQLFIGAMLAAEQGEDAIPKEWLEQTLLIGQIATMAHRSDPC